MVDRDWQIMDPTKPSDTCLVACASYVIQWEDWIAGQHFRLPQDPWCDGLVLRRVGGHFAIVGRAFALREWFGYEKDVLSDFDVYFDPEDFIVYAAASAASPWMKNAFFLTGTPPESDLDRFSIGICREPFSSFAKLRECEPT